MKKKYFVCYEYISSLTNSYHKRSEIMELEVNDTYDLHRLESAIEKKENTCEFVTIVSLNPI